jgi:hypothetical protein
MTKQAFKPVPVIITPKGQAVTIAQYVDAWNRVKALPPGSEVAGWQWYPVARESVLRDFTFGTLDRINKRGGIKTDWREPNQARITRTLEKRVSVSCRWCGSSMAYKRVETRFCCDSCRRDYFA